MEENEYFKRANFFPGLKATPGFWNGMEDYHFRKKTLYNILFHGSGIVPEYRQSLHVQAERTKGGLITLLVGSGLAIDGKGRPVFLKLFIWMENTIALNISKIIMGCGF